MKKMIVALLFLAIMVIGCAGEITHIDKTVYTDELNDIEENNSTVDEILTSGDITEQIAEISILPEIAANSPQKKEIQKPIVNGEEDYIFSFDYRYYFDEEALSSVNASVVLSIYDNNNLKIQEIEFESWNNWGPDSFYEINVNEWRVIDINFDGYADIVLLSSIGGAKANCSYEGWLWNPLTSMFEKTNIEEIINLSIHAEDQSLRSVIAASAGCHIFRIFRHIGGEFVLTNQLKIEAEVNFDGGCDCINHVDLSDSDVAYYVTVEEKELVGYELQTVISEAFCNTEENWAIVCNRLFGDDSLWFSGGISSFYASAYGEQISGGDIG